MNYFLTNSIINLSTQTMDMHLLLSCDLRLSRDGKHSTDEKVMSLKDEDFARNLFIETNTELDKQIYLFERRGFYSGPKTTRLIKYFEES